MSDSSPGLPRGASSDAAVQGARNPGFVCVLFDFDGTLADSGQCGVAATQWAFEDAGLAVPSAERIVAMMGIPIEKSFRDMASRPLSEEAFQQLLARFRQKYGELADAAIRPFDGVPALLQALHDAGVRTALVTSKKATVARRNLQTMGLEGWIDVVVGSEHVANYKPAPDGVHAALSALGLAAGPGAALARVLVVGDSSFDIQMGKAAGVTTCAVAWGAHSREALQESRPDHVVDDVAALRLLLLG